MTETPTPPLSPTTDDLLPIVYRQLERFLGYLERVDGTWSKQWVETARDLAATARDLELISAMREERRL